MNEGITYVGLDVHKRSIAVCVIASKGDELIEWSLENTAAAVRKLAKVLKKRASGVPHACYEAGPTGFTLQRQLESLGVACDVIAPSMIPRKPGERIKTDRRDARKLAMALRAGQLTRVEPPTEKQESVRDLVRARDAARIERMAARHRLAKFLDRRGIFYAGAHWTTRHDQFLAGIELDQPIDRWSFDHYRLAVQQAEARLEDLDRKIRHLAETEEYRQVVGRLRTLRGIDTYSAMVLIVELFEFGRFEAPRALMAYLGLVPSEESSGERVRRGAITKTGNGRVRRILIEAAQHQRRTYRICAALRKRRAGQPPWVLAIADRAGQRLNHRFRRLEARGKVNHKIVVAVAREMAGFVWSLLRPQAGRAAA